MRRIVGLLLAMGCFAGLVREHRAATDFPSEAPVAVVDAALVARLRAAPGLHLALDPGYRLATPLDLRDDPQNRWWYGTEVDLREAGVSRSGIHIQKKGPRMAIHADGWNPSAGVFEKVMHGTVDVPAIPMILGIVAGIWLVFRPRSKVNRSPAPRSSAGFCPMTIR